MSQKYTAELTGGAVGGVCVCVYIYVYMHTYTQYSRYKEILSKTEEQWAARVCLCLLQDAGQQTIQNIFFTVSTIR